MRIIYNHLNQRDSDEGIIKGLYKLMDQSDPQVTLIGSGSILNESIKAQKVLESLGITADVWSATSFNMLRKDGMEKERFNELNPTAQTKENLCRGMFAKFRYTCDCGN